MASGIRIYSFSWAVFDDLTSNAGSTVPDALAEALQDGKTARKLALSAKLPKTREALADRIRKLFLKPEWYVRQPSADVAMRHTLLLGMFFEKALKGIGLSASPTWREFYEDCSFDLGYVLAGRAILNLARIKRNNNKVMYTQYVPDARPGDNAFWWLGNRPFRHRAWTGSNDDWEEFEEKYEFGVYSIQSPSDVNLLARQLAEHAERFRPIECKELHESLADYENCIGNVKARNAGMFVENDT